MYWGYEHDGNDDDGNDDDCGLVRSNKGFEEFIGGGGWGLCCC